MYERKDDLIFNQEEEGETEEEVPKEENLESEENLDTFGEDEI